MDHKASNLQRLKDSGVYTGRDITPEEERLVESMTPEEVDMLIKLHNKLGGTASGRDSVRANFPL